VYYYFSKFKNLNIKNNNYTLLNIFIDSPYIYLLKNGNLISGLEEGTIKIYDKNSFEVKLKIKEHSEYINSINQLNDERIISCSGDKTAKIIELKENNKYEVVQTLIGHTLSVYKVIEIRNNELVSISEDNIMKIWTLKLKSFKCTNTIKISEKDDNIFNILKLNENELVISSSEDNFLKFYNSNNYKNISILNNIKVTSSLDNMALLNDDVFCVYGSKGFYLIKISTHQMIKNIMKDQEIKSMFQCFDKNILCSISTENIGINHSFIKYKYENEDLITVFEKNTGDYYDSIVENENGNIIVVGCEYILKLFS
jgi:WD40 repeat protein